MATSSQICAAMRRPTPLVRLVKAVLPAGGLPMTQLGAAGGVTRGLPFVSGLAGRAAGIVGTLPRALLGAQGSQARCLKRLARCTGGALTRSGTLTLAPSLATRSLVALVSGALAFGPTRPSPAPAGSPACRCARWGFLSRPGGATLRLILGWHTPMPCLYPRCGSLRVRRSPPLARLVGRTFGLPRVTLARSRVSCSRPAAMVLGITAGPSLP